MTAELTSGQMIGHYQIERRLGAGGMGVVYLARDTRLGRPAALKLLQANLTQDAARVRRFQQEARAASALNHPNIITIYEVGQTAPENGGLHFIATEFIDGRTLREQCHDGGMTLGAALELLLQTTNALATAHEAGIIHRDIKPENLMLRKDGLVKVLDFGLAKLTEQSLRAPGADFARVTTQPGIVMGTVSYMSPEQARGLKVDARSDLFSLGVVLYELFTGRAPFAGETTGDVLAALLSGEPRPLARYEPHLPDALQEIVKRALAKPVEQRYQTARELGGDLKRLKEEWEFAARLRGQHASQDPLLSLQVGAATDAAEQTTFATRTVSGAPAQASTAPRQAARSRRKTLTFALAALALLLAFAFWGKQWLTPRTAAIDSVAVLPFANEGNDPQMEYLPDGITESLINSLSQLTALRVTARATVFTYKGRALDPRQAGATFKVQAVVVGRVRRQGERLSISVELVNAADGARLWGEEYRRPLGDLLTVQEELAREIGQTLRLRLSGAEQRQLAKRYTQNTEAYQLYLLGRYHWNKRSRAGIRQSIEYFRQAAAKDPGYALAHVGLSDAYATLSSYNYSPAREVIPPAREAVARALNIDEQLAEAHASLGKLLTDYYWDWAQAERELQRALELNSNYANAHHWYAALLSVVGRSDEALVEARRALELDDLSPVASTQLGITLYCARRYDEAMAVLRKTLEQTPDFLTARIYLGLCYLAQDNRAAALTEFQRGDEAAPNNADVIALLGFIYGLTGQPAQARRAQARLNELVKHSYVPHSSFAAIHAGLGERDAYFKLMEQAFAERSPRLRSLKTDPLYDLVRADDRFDSLLKRVGLAP